MFSIGSPLSWRHSSFKELRRYGKRLYKTLFLNKESLVKERFNKKYRHPSLETKLVSQRLVAECRNISRARKAGVAAPSLYYVDVLSRRIYMEWIEGSEPSPLNESVTPCGAALTKCLLKICLGDFGKLVGAQVGRLHEADLIHGDLTTSNILISNRLQTSLIGNDTSNLSIRIIDFGLSYGSTMAEDKAVDLYVLERAICATHPSLTDLFQAVLDGYSSVVRNSYNSIMGKLSEGMSRLLFKIFNAGYVSTWLQSDNAEGKELCTSAAPGAAEILHVQNETAKPNLIRFLK